MGSGHFSGSKSWVGKHYSSPCAAVLMGQGGWWTYKDKDLVSRPSGNSSSSGEELPVISLLQRFGPDDKGSEALLSGPSASSSTKQSFLETQVLRPHNRLKGSLHFNRVAGGHVSG